MRKTVARTGYNDILNILILITLASLFIIINGNAVSLFADNLSTDLHGTVNFKIQDMSDIEEKSIIWFFDGHVDVNNNGKSSLDYVFNHPGDYSVLARYKAKNDEKGGETNAIRIHVNSPQFKLLVPDSTTLISNTKFTALSLPQGFNIAWDFGDGSFAKETVASHSYIKPGIYSINATFYDIFNNEFMLSRQIKVYPLAKWYEKILSVNSTSGGQVKFIDDSPGSVSGWLWNFGDGESSTEKSPVHTYKRLGTYSASLIVTKDGLTSTNENEKNVVIFNSIEEINVNPVQPEPNTPVTVSVDIADDYKDKVNYIRYQWGDSSPDEYGTQGPDFQSSHTYNWEAIFTLTIVSYAVGSSDPIDIVKIPIKVYKKTTPSSDFEAIPKQNGVAPFPVKFKVKLDEKGSNLPTGYVWNFGDGSSLSSEASPLHTYEKLGVYTVDLWTTNEKGNSNTTKNGFILVGDPPNNPCDFTAIPDTVYPGEPVQFIDTSIAEHNSNYWSFGDSSEDNSNEMNPIHVYKSANPEGYNVYLNIYKDGRIVGTSPIKKIIVKQREKNDSNFYLLLKPGWNLVSTPLKLAKGFDNIERLFKNTDMESHSVFQYNPVTGWKVMKGTDILHPLDAVWVYSNTTTNVDLYFENRQNIIQTDKNLTEGWNMIGASGVESFSVTDFLSQLQGNWTTLYYFDADKRAFQAILKNSIGNAKVNPGEGYWIYANGQGTIKEINIT